MTQSSLLLKVKKTGNSIYIYRNKLDKGCFQQHSTYGDFAWKKCFMMKLDEVLHNKNITKNPKYDGYHLASMVNKSFHKNVLVVVLKMEKF